MTRHRAIACLMFACLTGCAHPPATPALRPAAIATAVDEFVDLNEVTIRYRVAGKGDPVFLIHGYSNSLEVWSGVGDSLAQEHMIVALDLRGFGKSTKFGRPEQFGRRLADDIVRLADALRIRRFDLVGHSMGALVSANVAARYPDRVRTVTLIAGPFWPDSLTAAAVTRPYYEDLGEGRGVIPMIRWLLPMLDSATVRQSNDATLAQNDLASLRAVLLSLGSLIPPLNERPDIPALIAVGMDDPLRPYSHDLAGKWSQAQLLELPADHVSILMRPELLATIRATLRAAP